MFIVQCSCTVSPSPAEARLVISQPVSLRVHCPDCIITDMASSPAMAAPFGLHAGYKNSTLRLWQAAGTELHSHNFMLPLFITDESPDAK